MKYPGKNIRRGVWENRRFSVSDSIGDSVWAAVFTPDKWPVDWYVYKAVWRSISSHICFDVRRSIEDLLSERN